MIPWAYDHMLTILIASPLFGIIILLIIPKRHEEAASEIALAGSGLTFFLSVVMFSLFRFGQRFEFIEKHAWFPSIGSEYHVAVDGLSALFILIVALAVLVTVLIVWKGLGPNQRKALTALLAFELGMIGFFSSVDILLMYVFMEISVFSLVVMILATGKAFPSKFVGFMSVSSIVFLIVIIFLTIAADSSDLTILENVTISSMAQVWIFFALLVATFCRMGLFPFHSWVGELSRQARGYWMVLLVSFIFISGAYIFYRLLPSLAVASALFRPAVSWFVVSSIIISALISLSQNDIKSLFVYVFMTHLGFALLGLVSATPQGFAGSGMEFIAISLSFLMLALIFAPFERRGAEPAFGICFFVFVLAVSVLPGLSHFPGLFMIWMGLFKGSWMMAMIAIAGTSVMAAALIRMLGSVLVRGNNHEQKKSSVKFADIVFIVPVIVLMLIIGIFPDIVLKYVKHSTEVVWKVFSKQI